MLLGGIGRRESDAEQTPFPATTDSLRKVQKWGILDGAFLDDTDAPLLLNDEQAPASIPCVGNPDRQLKAPGDFHECHLRHLQVPSRVFR